MKLCKKSSNFIQIDWGNVNIINIDQEMCEKLIRRKPRFVGLSAEYEFDIEIERQLLETGIISYENLINVEQLPVSEVFQFYGIPLRIREGDGSPVRAFAEIDD